MNVDMTPAPGLEDLEDQLAAAAGWPAPEPPEPEPDPIADLLARVRTGAWLDAQDFPPLEWSVPGILAEGFGLIVGPPKIGKSWFVLGIGLAVACGGRALAHLDVQQRPVLYAALEDGDKRMQRRCRDLMVGQKIPAAFNYFTSATPGEILPLIDAWLARHPGGLVMLDTLGKVMPAATPGESAYQRDYRVGGHLKRITERHAGSTLLVVHHNRKVGSADWMDSTSGTQGLNGSADYTVVLERPRGETRATIKVTGRDVEENEYAATVTAGAWTLDGHTLAEAAQAAREVEATANLGDKSSEIVRTVNQYPDGAALSVIARRLGMEPKDAGKYLGRLTAAGRIRKLARGLYGPVESGESGESDPYYPPVESGESGENPPPDSPHSPHSPQPLGGIDCRECGATQPDQHTTWCTQTYVRNEP